MTTDLMVPDEGTPAGVDFPQATGGEWTDGKTMKNTYEPQLIYDMFSHYGFNVLRIDQFDSGSFAKIRAELNYELLNAGQLLEIATRLISMEKNENLDIQVVMVDMRHRTMTVNILVREQEATIIQ